MITSCFLPNSFRSGSEKFSNHQPPLRVDLHYCLCICVCMYVYVSVCVCFCVRERDRAIPLKTQKVFKLSLIHRKRKRPNRNKASIKIH